MSHADVVSKLPKNFRVIASSANSRFAIVEDKLKNFYGVQFHPEVTHTENGKMIIKNFLFLVCKIKKNWSVKNQKIKLINEVRNQVGKNKAICLFQQEILDSLSANGHPISPGSTGENILIKGIKIGSISVGTCLRIGDVEVIVTQDAPPCKTIRNSFVDGEFNKISHRKNPNFTRWYASVNFPGTIRVGDVVKLIN